MKLRKILFTVAALSATALTLNAQALPKATYHLGLTNSNLNLGVKFDGKQLNKDWKMNYGADVALPALLVAGYVGAEHSFKFDNLNFSFNPHLHAGVLQSLPLVGAGAGLTYHIDQKWGVLLNYRLVVLPTDGAKLTHYGTLAVTYKQ